MNPINNLSHLMGHDSESSENEDSHSSVDSTSAGVLVVPSTSMVFPIITINLPSPVSSVSVIDLRSPIQLAASTPPAHPMSPVPSTSRGIQENHDDYRFEAARRWSFRYWPISFIDPVSLAAAGFYYTGETDIVKCFECQLVTNLWTVGDIPVQIHEMRSRQCRFIRNEHCDNVPIGADPDKVLRTERRNRNKSCRYGLQYKESFDINEHRFLRNARKPTAYELCRLGLKKVMEPESLEYATYESRLNSFETWPAYVTQKSEELADAGFYYSGINDVTTCYHCGIYIDDWIPGEVPWEQHAIASPKCCYLLAVRGWEYVNKITGKKKYETSAETSIEITEENPDGSDGEDDTNEMTLLEKIAALEIENRALKDARLCKVCTEREATITFLPCGHLATCDYCSPAFRKCIICQREIKAVTRTFLA